MKPVLTIVTIFLALMSLGHLLRLILQVQVVAHGITVPLWLSAVACVFTGSLAILLWRENR